MSDDPTFEASLHELEEIADSLERDDLDLAEALRLFERGVERLRAASRLLDDAQGKVEELVQAAAGSLEVRPADSGSEDPCGPDLD